MLALVFCFIVFVLWFVNDWRRCAGYPPGPLRLPLVGNLPQIMMSAATSRTPFEGLKKLSDKYGGVMHLRLGMVDTIIFSSYESITKQFGMEINNNRLLLDFLADRNQNMNLGYSERRQFQNQLNYVWLNLSWLIVSSGEVWKTLRPFTIRGLRDFGFGKSSSLDQMINDELNKLIAHFDQFLKANNGVLHHMENSFDLPVINVLWRLVSGKQYELDDMRFKRLLKFAEDYMASLTFAGVAIAYPTLSRYFPSLSARELQMNCIDNLKNYMTELIDECKSTGMYTTDPQCFIDAFLAAIVKAEKAEESSFNERQLLYVLLDLFQAGTETTSRTMSFAVLYMMANPEIQKKIQDEIDKVVPASEPITLAVKTKLPYVSATILEVLRIATPLPIGTFRETEKDIYFEGYKIKKGVCIMLNLQAANHQESLWGDPQVFRPERFLTPEMEIDTKFAERIVSFGGGKRMCLGRQFAESILFIYFTSLLRKYVFKVPPGNPTPTTAAKPGLNNAPFPFDVEVYERNK